MTTRCKFRCSEVREHDGSRKTYSAKFYAVHSGSPENETVWKYTPSDSLELQMITTQPFDVGKEYYLDISESVPVAFAV